MARGTLALPYLSDDFEHGQLIAQIRAGLAPGRDLIVLPFHGQTTGAAAPAVLVWNSVPAA